MNFWYLSHILGHKKKHCMLNLYRGLSPIDLSQTIFHSLSADSWIMSSLSCPSCHLNRTKLIEQLRPTVLSSSGVGISGITAKSRLT